jgi:glycosyltransferase involved in cell wall biosynthesis
VKDVDYCSGASLLISTKLFHELGGFDVLYIPAYCEDSDLAFRVRTKGLRVRYQPESVVVHYEGISHGTEVNTGIKAYQISNQKKFHDRWNMALERENFPSGEEVFLAKDRSVLRKNILIIDHYIPLPDRDAGSRTIWQFIQLFLHHGMSVKFWPQNAWHDPIYSRWLEQAGVEIFYGSEYAGKFEQWIKGNGSNIDYIMLSRPQVAVDFIDSIRHHSAASVLYYGHDIHYLRLQSQLKVKHDGSIAREMIKMQKCEQYIWGKVDTIYYPSDEEISCVCDWLKTHSSTAKALAVPAYAYDRFPESPWQNLCERKDLVFVAGFGHPPNSDAAEWLVREILPQVHAVLPNVHLYLVGSNPTDKVKALSGPRITVTGFVSDDELADFNRNARVSVAPLRFGGGVKGKVVEAMFFGLPCVTTSIGAQGLTKAEAVLAVADDPTTFAQHILRLFSDDDAWINTSRQSQNFVKEYFSQEAMWHVFENDVDPTPYPDAAIRMMRHRSDSSGKRFQWR